MLRHRVHFNEVLRQYPHGDAVTDNASGAAVVGVFSFLWSDVGIGT